MLPSLTVTPAAEKFMRRIVRFSGFRRRGIPSRRECGRLLGLQLGVQCRGGAQPGEQTLVVNGDLRLFLPAESRLLLEGCTMDFADTPTQSGLTFVNPKQAACGCSTAETATPPGMATISVSAIGRGRPVAPVLAS